VHVTDGQVRSVEPEGFDGVTKMKDADLGKSFRLHQGHDDLGAPRT
jgi:hypothetical protein